MLIVISPAKTLDFETPPISKEHTQPDFLDDSAELISALKKLEPDQIGRLMSISPTLATLIPIAIWHGIVFLRQKMQNKRYWLSRMFMSDSMQIR